MQISFVCLAALLALTACGPARGVREARLAGAVPTLEPGSPNEIWVLENRMPRCPVREMGRVSGRDYRALQNAAFRLKANVVILEPEGMTEAGIRTGNAVQYTRADCKE